MAQIHVAVVRMIVAFGGYKQPEVPQFRSQTFDYYLFTFLGFAWPLVATMAFLFGVQTVRGLLRRNEQSLVLRGLLCLYIFGALSYLLPLLDGFVPLILQIASMGVSCWALASLARSREVYRLTRNPRNKMQQATAEPRR